MICQETSLNRVSRQSLGEDFHEQNDSKINKSKITRGFWYNEAV